MSIVIEIIRNIYGSISDDLKEKCMHPISEFASPVTIKCKVLPSIRSIKLIFVMRPVELMHARRSHPVG